MNVLVDTSVWIDFLNADVKSSKADILQKILAENFNIYICPLIYQEILQGIRSPKTFREIKNILLSFFLLNNDLLTVTDYAIDLYRHLQKHGTTIRKSADCLIAAYAILADMPLLHKDRDFTQIAKHSRLSVCNR